MKKLISIILFALFAACPAQDSTLPFKFVGEGKWMTITEFVRQYDRDLSDLEFYDSAYAELEKQISIYRNIVDSLKDQVSMYKKIIEAKDDIILNNQSYIKHLESPREITARRTTEESSFVSFDGVFLNLGTNYRFESLSVTGEKIIKGLKYFGSVETGWLFMDKVKLDLEVVVPPEIRLKGGIKL